MRSYSLSTTFQKIICILIDLFFIGFHVLVFIASDTPIGLLVLFFLFTLTLCVFYTWIVFFSVIIVDEARELLIYRIIKSAYFDLRDVKAVKIEQRQSGNQEKDVIVLLNERGFNMGEINPYLTKKTLPILSDIYQEIERVINH